MNRPAYQIILAPLVTEKSTRLKDNERLLCFKVARDASKIQIRKAVESLFSVKVDTVRTAQMHGKAKRVGRNLGRRPDWKKAWVRLTADSGEIEFFEAS